MSIAKVDADAHKDLGRKFGVQGFPTLKWFDGKSDKPEDYNSGRDLESLTKFITDKTGIKPRSNKAPSAVQMLNDKAFNETVGGEKNVLVAFTAPWCGRMSSSAGLMSHVKTRANPIVQIANPSPQHGKNSPAITSPSPRSSSQKSTPNQPTQSKSLRNRASPASQPSSGLPLAKGSPRLTTVLAPKKPSSIS